jgi:tRNA 2-thiouridine synthesizing protein C
VPNLADLLYSYPDIRVIAHEPSLAERGIMVEALVETVELMDEEYFLKAIKDSEGLIIL